MKEIDIIAEGLDDNNKKVTKLSALIEKQKKESEKDSKNAEKGDNKIITILTNMCIVFLYVCETFYYYFNFYTYSNNVFLNLSEL